MEGVLQTSISFIFLCIFSFHTESIELYAVSLLSSVMMFILFFVVSTGKNRTVCRLRSSSSVPQPALLSARQQGRDLSMLKWAHVFPQFASSLIGKSVVQGWLNEWWRQYLTHSSLYFFLLFFFQLTVCAIWSQDCQGSDNFSYKPFLETVKAFCAEWHNHLLET